MLVVYVVSVLLVSGFMSANAATLADYSKRTQYQSPVRILDATIGETNSLLNVWGTLPNPCYGEPAALLTQDAMAPNVLVIRVTAALPPADNICIAVLNDFNAVIDLKELARSSRLDIVEGQTYLIKLEGSSFAIEMPGSDLL